MESTRLALALVLALVCATCGGNGSGPQSVLPGNNQFESWELAEAPNEIETEARFYNMVDGGAPTYIDRGWVSSVYAEYRRDGESIQVAVHDMGTSENAETLFNTLLPASRTELSSTSESDPGGRRPNAVLDVNLQRSHAAEAFSNRYYMEIEIDRKTDTALADITAFVLELIDRARLAQRIL